MPPLQQLSSSACDKWNIPVVCVYVYASHHDLKTYPSSKAALEHHIPTKSMMFFFSVSFMPHVKIHNCSKVSLLSHQSGEYFPKVLQLFSLANMRLAFLFSLVSWSFLLGLYQECHFCHFCFLLFNHEP